LISPRTVAHKRHRLIGVTSSGAVESEHVTGLFERPIPEQDASRYSPLVRVLRIMRLLNRWRSIEELAEMENVSHRSVRRYMWALSGAGFDVRRDDSGSRVVWKIFGERK
jgi:hypothetical protein